jgi:hypothetical protein
MYIKTIIKAFVVNYNVKRCLERSQYNIIIISVKSRLTLSRR